MPAGSKYARQKLTDLVISSSRNNLYQCVLCCLVGIKIFEDLLPIGLRSAGPPYDGSANLNRDDSGNEKSKTIGFTDLVIVLGCTAPGAGQLSTGRAEFNPDEAKHVFRFSREFRRGVFPSQ